MTPLWSMTMISTMRDWPRNRRSICPQATGSESLQRRRSMTRRLDWLRAFLNWSEIVFFSDPPSGALNSQTWPSMSTSGFFTPFWFTGTLKTTSWPAAARAWAVRISCGFGRGIPSGIVTDPFPEARRRPRAPLKDRTGPYSPCSVTRSTSR